MNAPVQPIAEVSQRATRILIQESGVVDAIRFLNQFTAGDADDTTQRDHPLQGQSVASIANEIEARRVEGPPAGC